MATQQFSCCRLCILLLAAFAHVRRNEATKLVSGGVGHEDAATRARAAFSLVGTWKSGAEGTKKSDQDEAHRTDLVGTKKSDLVGSQAKLELVGSSTAREASKAEIMADMTVEKAYDIFMRMNNSVDASLVDLIESKFGDAGHRKGGKNLRHIQKHNTSRKYDGLSGLYSARDMLNAMMYETIMNKEIENVKCEKYEYSQLNVIWESQQEIDYVNAQAADARAAQLRAGEMISTISETKIPSLTQQLEQNEAKCKEERGALNGQIELVSADLGVLKGVFGMVECEAVPMRDLMPPPLRNASSLLDLHGKNGGNATWKAVSAHDKAEDGALVQCPACAPGARPVVHIRHTRVQAQLQKLRTDMAKEFVREHLQEAFLEIELRDPTKIRKAVFIQADGAGNKKSHFPGQEELNFDEMNSPGQGESCSEAMGQGLNGAGYRGCQSQTIKGNSCQKWTSQYPHNHTGVTNETGPGNQFGLGDFNYCRNPTPDTKETIWCFTNDPNSEWEYCQPVEELQAPDGMPQFECATPSGCKIGPGNCEKMRDRFLIILAGVNDHFTQLQQDLAELDQECKNVQSDLTSSINALNVQLQQEETNLATATKNIQEATNQENLASKAHKEYIEDYQSQMQECCDNKNGFLSELCSLEKLRGQLFKQQGEEVTITDCALSDWTDSECSATCAGGQQTRKRTVIAPRINGTDCPPKDQARDCNMQKCPIDCEVSTWSEWTECTAMCGGGVRTRIRPMTQRPKYAGEACPQMQETENCKIQSCNEDCVIADWGEWTGCSKACNTGHRERRAPLEVEARGQGVCVSPDSIARLNFEECNKKSCMLLLAEGEGGSNRTTLQCHSKLDIIVLMDASGSLEEYGFNQSKAMAQRVVSAMIGGEENVKIAFLMYGGPNTLQAYERCTGGGGEGGMMEGELDIQFECGMHWVAHFTGDTAAVAARVGTLPYPISTTMTSMALAEAKTVLASGRQEADSVVVVITDAKPMSYIKTAKAAEEMKKDARLIWVPIGSTTPKDLENMKAWASKPWEDNVVPVPDIDSMTTPKTLNNIISSVCPDVK